MKMWLCVFFGVPAIVGVVAGLSWVGNHLWAWSRLGALIIAWALFSGFVAFMVEHAPEGLGRP